MSVWFFWFGVVVQFQCYFVNIQIKFEKNKSSIQINSMKTFESKRGEIALYLWNQLKSKLSLKLFSMLLMLLNLFLIFQYFHFHLELVVLVFYLNFVLKLVWFGLLWIKQCCESLSTNKTNRKKLTRVASKQGHCQKK